MSYLLLKIPIETINLFISSFGVVFAGILVIFAYIELRGLRKSQNEEFLQKLSRDFFSDETVKLITLIHSNAISFDGNNHAPIFRIDTERINNIYPNRNWNDKEYYTSYEIDDLILNELSVVGILLLKRIINIKSTYEYFGWYVSIIGANAAINEYFDWIKSHENSEFTFRSFHRMQQKFAKKGYTAPKSSDDIIKSINKIT